MKGFVIIAIVMIHVFIVCGTESVGDVTESGGFPLYLQAIYTGLMMFFIASGYFFRPGRGYLTNVLKRVVPLGVALVVCVLVLPLILFCWLAVLGQSPDLSQYPYIIGRLAGSEALFLPFDTWIYEPPTLDTTNGYYFLEIMFVSFIVFYAIADFSTRSFGIFATVTTALLTSSALLIEVVDIRLPMYGELVPMATAFMIVGAYAGKRSLAEWMESGWWLKRSGWAMFAALFAVSAVVVSLFPPGNNFDSSQLGAYGGWSVYPFFVLGCSVSFFFLMFFAVLTRSRIVSKSLGFVGKHTLGILLGHVLGMKMIISLFYRLDSVRYMSPGIPSATVFFFGIADVLLCLATILCAFRLAGKARKQFRINPNV